MIKIRFLNKESFIIKLLLLLIIIEIPFGNLFLIAPTLMLCYKMIENKKLIITKQSIILAAFIISYFTIDTTLEQSITYKVWYALSVISCYATGYYTKFKDIKVNGFTKKITNTIGYIAKIYFLYVTVNLGYSIIQGQLLNNRNPLNIWTGTPRAATHFGTMLVIPLAYSMWLMMTGEKKCKKILGTIMTIMSIIFTIMMASRTILLFVPIAFVSIYFCNIKMTGKFEKKHLNQLLLCILIVVFLFLMYMLNIFQFRTFLSNSQLGKRYAQGSVTTITEDGRMLHIIYLFSHLKESFWGGGYTRLHSGNLHNIYLNVYDLSGIIPFLLLVVFSVHVMKTVLKILKMTIINKSCKILIVVVYVLIFIQFLMEPVMESVPSCFWSIMYISGMVEKCMVEGKKIYEDSSCCSRI